KRRRELIAALDGPGRPPAEGPDATPMGVFLAHVLHPFTAYVPPPALARLTLAAGADSHGQPPYHAAEFLADGSLLELPGGHLGALEHPEEFADRLAEALTSTSVEG
ncbi:hypothetical protein GT030_20220, partial [Streptomyces sp. SID1328]|nr:hypothetical protein [Streptomyces sp. SID1328]